MNNKSWCNGVLRKSLPRIFGSLAKVGICASLSVGLSPGVLRASDAPSWMHALTNVALPDHDEKTDAVLLYSEEVLTVQGSGKIKRLTRRAYKILRTSGKDYGVAVADFDAETKILNMHAWCIPASGKDYEVKEKDAIETSLRGVANGELVSDLRTKLLQIPASDPGNIVGYEIEQEERPYILQDLWMFQSTVPTVEARYSLQLPTGWEYKTVWLNASESKPTASGVNGWQWTVKNVKAIRPESEMPPWHGIAGQMLISLLPPGGSKKGFETWVEMSKWEAGLAEGRRDASPEIKQKVAELTAKAPTQLAKMQAIAQFVQQDIRYVAIELGIGGLQPHAAKDTFAHRYGDCKDKATLTSSMLKEIGVDSYYISINVERGGADEHAPPTPFWFNHRILGVHLPEDMKSPALISIYMHPKLGRILIFDPTDEMTPFGQLRGQLQANYGLLLTPDGGDLIEMPQLSPSMSGTRRTGKLALNSAGTLSGEVVELLYGDHAAYQRYTLQTTSKDTDRIKPIESLLAHSLGTFQITNATVANFKENDQPLQYRFSFTAEKYAKPAANLLLLRPRVLGNKSSDLLEKKEPRKYAVEFDGPRKDVDTFEIALPAGYEVDELPPPTDADFSFGSYHSKTELKGNALQYTRTLEIKELSVPVEKVEELKKFYRMIAGDERNAAVLKVAGH